MADPHRPQCALPYQFGDGHAGFAAGRRKGRQAPRRLQPGNDPEQGQPAEDHEHRAPAVRCNDQPAGERADNGAERNPYRDGAVGDAALLWRDVAGDDLGGAGKRNAFAETQQEPENDQAGKAARQPHQHRADRPQRDAGGEQAIDAPAVARPADEILDRRIDPEEGRHREPELGRAKPQFGLQQRRGDRDRAAVDIIEQHGEAEQKHQAKCDWSRRYCR